MTLELLIQVLCEFGLKRNLVNYASSGPSIYALNPEDIKCYPLFFISPTERINVGKNTTEYGLTIYFADRLLDDSSNETQIFSVGAETLTNFIRQISELEGIVEVGDPSIRLFTNSEKMQNRLAGAYTTVIITVLNEVGCPTYFDSEGQAIGSFLPAGYGDIKTLVTEEQFLNTIKKYTLTKDFAKINGSAITEGGNIIIQGGSGVTPDLTELSAQTVNNTAQIEAISGNCGSLRTDLDTLSAYTESIVIPDMSNYATTADTASLSAITSGISGTVVVLSEQIIEQFHNIENISAQTSAITYNLSVLSAYTETISGATPELIGSAVTSANAYTDEKIGELTIPTKTSDLENDSGFITSADTENFVTSAQTKEQIESYDYTTSAVTETIINSALTGYYNSGQTNQAISAATQNMVTSTTIRTIWSGSASDYDSITVKDPNTFYIIL